MVVCSVWLVAKLDREIEKESELERKKTVNHVLSIRSFVQSTSSILRYHCYRRNKTNSVSALCNTTKSKSNYLASAMCFGFSVRCLAHCLFCPCSFACQQDQLGKRAKKGSKNGIYFAKWMKTKDTNISAFHMERMNAWMYEISMISLSNYAVVFSSHPINRLRAPLCLLQMMVLCINKTRPNHSYTQTHTQQAMYGFFQSPIKHKAYWHKYSINADLICAV